MIIFRKTADNPGVTAHMIAKDALGLIRQDVGGRHGELLAGLLDLLRHLTLSGPPSERSELRGSPLPIALLPVFFTLTVNHSQHDRMNRNQNCYTM